MKTAKADFFKPAPLPPPKSTHTNRLKQLQCAAMWAGWRLLEVVPGGFAFVNIDNEGDRQPTSGWMNGEEVERFIHARELERRW